jgi:hypothetical protein
MKDFWQHTNGKVYAVRSDSYGRITGAAGPLDECDLRGVDDYEYGPAIVEWVKQAMAEKKLHRMSAPLPRINRFRPVY